MGCYGEISETHLCNPPLKTQLCQEQHDKLNDQNAYAGTNAYAQPRIFILPQMTQHVCLPT